MKVAAVIGTRTGGATSEEEAAERRGRAGRAVLNPFDARAIEQGLRLLDAAQGGELVLLTVGSASLLAIVREGLALGASRAVILEEHGLEQADPVAMGKALAALIATEQPDVVLGCFWSGDIDGSLMLGAAAATWGKPYLAQAQSLQIEGDEAVIRRQVEDGDLTMAASLPCVVDLAVDINKPRYPTMKGKLAAKSKPVRMITWTELGAAPPLSATGLIGLVPSPPRRTPVLLDGANATAGNILAYLQEQDFVS